MDSFDPSIRYTSSVRVLFLDFDGVLHPEFCHSSKHFIHLVYFEEVIRAFPGIELVISSTWRLSRTLEELREMFSTDIAARVIGTTPRYPQLEEVPETLVGYEREAECRAWLLQQGYAAREWLAVDDRSWNFRPFNRNTFLVDGDIGLDADASHSLFRRLRDGAV